MWHHSEIEHKLKKAAKLTASLMLEIFEFDHCPAQ